MTQRLALTPNRRESFHSNLVSIHVCEGARFCLAKPGACELFPLPAALVVLARCVDIGDLLNSGNDWETLPLIIDI